jgi:hypothetical protein
MDYGGLTGHECKAVCNPGEYAFTWGSQFAQSGGCSAWKRGASGTFPGGGCCKPGTVQPGDACVGATPGNPAGNCANGQPCVAGFCGGAQAGSPVAECAASGGTWNGTSCVASSSSTPPSSNTPPGGQACGIHSTSDSKGVCHCDAGYTWVSDTSNDCTPIASKYQCGVHSTPDASGNCHCDDGYTWVSETSNDCVPVGSATAATTQKKPIWPWVAGAIGLAVVIGGGVYVAKSKK